jgi:catechol 2,3-dioxygenase-like lactoylglutathione lyase family enzyme
MSTFKKSIPALPVVNIKKAVDFYESKLGFKARHQEGGFAIVVRDSVEIHLWQACDKSWRFRLWWIFRPIQSGAESFIAGTASCRIEVNGIDELYEEYKAQNILHKVHPEIADQYWGHRDFNAVDLYGNLLTFYQEIN